MAALPLSGDWFGLRCRFAGEALARILAFCGYDAQCVRLEGAHGALYLSSGETRVPLRVGPVEPLWRGKPLNGEAADWPREISVPAARFFLTARPLAAAVALDFDLAARRDLGNPFYATAYTLRRLRALLSRPEPEGAVPPALPPEERALALAVGRFPAAVRLAAEGRDPYPVNRYAVELAAELRRFMHAAPMAGENRRLGLAAGTALGNAFALLGVL